MRSRKLGICDNLIPKGKEMQHFKLVPELQPFDLILDWQMLIAGNEIDHLPEFGYEVCINGTTVNTDDWTEGTGSLHWDWNNTQTYGEYGVGHVVVPAKKNPKKETDFKYLCTQFHGTVFEDLWNYFNDWSIGRIRLIRSNPKTSLTWHVEGTSRLNFPVATCAGARMVIQDESIHMRSKEWYWADTTKWHTAFNGSRQQRYHVVVSALDDSEFTLVDIPEEHAHYPWGLQEVIPDIDLTMS